MTLHHFNALSQEKQRQWVLQQGTYLCCRHSRDFTVLLFQVGPFYIELYYYTATNSVFLIKSFDDPDELQPYFDQIDIAPVLPA